jgi:hypothetical protein
MSANLYHISSEEHDLAETTNIGGEVNAENSEQIFSQFINNMEDFASRDIKD